MKLENANQTIEVGDMVISDINNKKYWVIKQEFEYFNNYYLVDVNGIVECNCIYIEGLIDVYKLRLECKNENIIYAFNQ